MATPGMQSGQPIDERFPTLRQWRWWTVALRGVAAVLLGLFSLFMPGLTFLALVVLFGIYAIIDGALTLSVAARVAGALRSGSVIARGVASILAGVVALIWPGIGALALLLVIASWALVTGILEIVTAVRLRQMLRHEWLYIVQGILSIAFGVALFVSPLAGAVVLGLWVGAYAFVVGVLLIGAGFQLRKHQHQMPQGGTLAPA